MTLTSHHFRKAEEKNPSKSSGKERSGEMQKKKLGAKSKMKAEFSVSSLPGRLSSQKM